MGKSCWFCGDFSACWCGKINIEVGWSQLGGWTKRVGFVVTFRRVGAGKSTLKLVVSSWARAWSLDLSRWGLGRLFAATVSTVPGHRARPLAAPRGAVLPAALPAVLPAALPAASVAALPAVL